jgi:hypothetical protein
MYGRRRKFAHVPAMDGALAVEAFQAALAAGEPITLVLVCSLVFCRGAPVLMLAGRWTCRCR